MNIESVDLLLVEDNPHDAELYQRSFKKFNLLCNAYHVQDGEEALNFLFATGAFLARKNSKNPRMVLLDLSLPKVAGIEVLRKMRADDRTKSIPVVVLTGSNSPEKIAQCYQLGINSYVVKPVDAELGVDTACKVSLYWLLINKPPGN